MHTSISFNNFYKIVDYSGLIYTFSFCIMFETVKSYQQTWRVRFIKVLKTFIIIFLFFNQIWLLIGT